MESVGKTCQWKGCTSPAVKHAALGLNVFDSKLDLHTSEPPFAPEHYDLCFKHLELARLQYVHVAEYELDECPKRDGHQRK